MPLTSQNGATHSRGISVPTLLIFWSVDLRKKKPDIKAICLSNESFQRVELKFVFTTPPALIIKNKIIEYKLCNQICIEKSTRKKKLNLIKIVLHIEDEDLMAFSAKNPSNLTNFKY